jgi:murein tripeptide amidase MpaA
MSTSKDDKRKFYWHANTSSGGTLSLGLNLTGEFSKEEKESALAEGIRACVEHMEAQGFIPHNALLMSSGDIAREYGKTRQYWEKLLNEGKIHYKETSAGRITTNLWVKGYLDNREKVNKYVRDVNTVLDTISATKRTNGRVLCPVCREEKFEFGTNREDYTNGICRACGFYVHTAK